MAVQFKVSGVPLFKSTSVPAMDADCCCDTTCTEENNWGRCPTPQFAQLIVVVSGGAFPCTGLDGTYILAADNCVSASFIDVVCPGDPFSMILINYNSTSGLLTIGVISGGVGFGTQVSEIMDCRKTTHTHGLPLPPGSPLPGSFYAYSIELT